MDNSIMYVINKDNCPKKDNIIIAGQCKGCEYYAGFELYFGQQCVKCSYNAKQIKNNDSHHEN